jgi:hypothetical protein
MQKASATPQYTYDGFAYRQNESADSPWLVTFVASAESVRAWASIPRRHDGTPGFQRIDDPERVKNAKEFFDDFGRNQSPTAIVLGLHKTTPDSPVRTELEFCEPDNADPGVRGPIRRCKLKVFFPAVEQLPDVATRLSAHIADRIRADNLIADDSAEEAESNDEESQDNDSEDNSDDVDQIDAENDDEESETDDATDSEIDLGTSLLQEVQARLSDTTWVNSNEETVRELAKPATVIDGQHRLLGAFACERGIPFCFCALFNCDWPEQIVQVTIINYTQSKIPDQFITANAALSLTQVELRSLKDRLIHSGVKVLEYELMQVVTFTATSAFFDKVNLSEKPAQGKIGYKTMVQVAKAWYSPPQKAGETGRWGIINKIFGDITGRGAKGKRLVEWKKEYWGEFFLAFWSIVRDNYVNEKSHSKGHFLWDVGHSQLVVAAVLRELQQQFFLDLNGQDDDWFDVPGETRDEIKDALLAKVRQRAAKFIEWFPAEFFSTKWEETSLNMGSGRNALVAALSALRESKGRGQWKKTALVVGVKSTGPRR